MVQKLRGDRNRKWLSVNQDLSKQLTSTTVTVEYSQQFIGSLTSPFESSENDGPGDSVLQSSHSSQSTPIHVIFKDIFTLSPCLWTVKTFLLPFWKFQLFPIFVFSSTLSPYGIWYKHCRVNSGRVNLESEVIELTVLYRGSKDSRTYLASSFITSSFTTSFYNMIHFVNWRLWYHDAVKSKSIRSTLV